MSKESADRPMPLPVARALWAVDQAQSSGGPERHPAVMRLADSIIYYLGALGVAQYSQALYLGRIEADATLSRSLRSLKRVLPGQWLLWSARSLAATPGGPVVGLSEWYSGEESGPIVDAYEALRKLMSEYLGYSGEYGVRSSVSPRVLLEMVDQYRVRLGRVPVETLPGDFYTRVAEAVLPGLRALVQSASLLAEYPLYAPRQRQLLMGSKPTTPMPPIIPPVDVAETATLLLYPPGEEPDYTKRPTLGSERVPLFPLDPLLVYLLCPACDRPRVAALRESSGEGQSYVGLDPECDHVIK